MLIQKLEKLARETGYTLEREGRKVKWRRNDNKNVNGISDSISEAYEDISLDYQHQLKINIS
jgi:hypothetical protein